MVAAEKGDQKHRENVIELGVVMADSDRSGVLLSPRVALLRDLIVDMKAIWRRWDT